MLCFLSRAAAHWVPQAAHGTHAFHAHDRPTLHTPTATGTRVYLHVRAASAQDPHVRGAYTYPTRGAELGDRAALAAPVANALFFAGEATNEAINPCIQVRMRQVVQACSCAGV
jgi:hypothetical protein